MLGHRVPHFQKDAGEVGRRHCNGGENSEPGRSCSTRQTSRAPKETEVKKASAPLVGIPDVKNTSKLSAEPPAMAIPHVRPRPTVLALDLEATLISSAVSQFPRPGLFEFLERCKALFPRVVMFTTIREERFRVIARTLVEEGTVPAWFARLECVGWTGPTKDLKFIAGCTPEEALLVDDLSAYVHSGQHSQWVQVEPFQPPFLASDQGLTKVLEELEKRARPPALPGTRS